MAINWALRAFIWCNKRRWWHKSARNGQLKFLTFPVT